MVKFMLCTFGKKTMEVILCPDQDVVSKARDIDVTSDITNDDHFKMESARLLQCKTSKFSFCK